ncbi:MAG: LacI family DNA-binding transcriptional regulator, partial [Eubacteriales bacterium]|nr:LacI family DNA-binding transcriptional regulator [Eubacteriales bacterium]
MTVTIRDLSKRCGLSVSTVSKALNGYADISAATRERVTAAARELGYFPNAHARALKTKRSYNLGVLFVDDSQSGLTHSYFAAVLESFKKEAENGGYDITFISHNMAGNSMTYLEHCHYREVDGVCIACINFDDPEVAQLVASELPVVTIDHLFNNRSCIQSNNVEGMRLLVSRARELGHERIAYAHGPKSSVTDTRLASFYRAMAAQGLEAPEEYVVESEYTNPRSAYEAVTRLLRLPRRPTCVFVSDDCASLGALEAAADLGLRVPEDLSVAGYDGIAMTQLMR